MAKIRNGFVSNSSSSSFIIAGNDKPKITIEINIERLCSYVVKTKEQLDEAIKGFYYTNIESLEGYELIIYNKCLSALENEKTIYFGSATSDGDPEDNFLYYSGLGEERNFDTIQDIG